MEEKCKVIQSGKFPNETCNGCGYFDDSVDGEVICTKELNINHRMEDNQACN